MYIGKWSVDYGHECTYQNTYYYHNYREAVIDKFKLR